MIEDMRSRTASVTLDGSYGEGGGALLRAALVMSAMTQQSVQISDIRGGTRHTGLDVEDIALIAALAESTEADELECRPGDHSLTFVPRKRPKGRRGPLPSSREIGGRRPSAPILLNSLLPVYARTGIFSSLRADGETFGNNTLGFDAFAFGALELHKKTGLYAFPTLERAGYGRESNGEVSLDIEPSELTGLNWTDRGAFLDISAVVTSSNLTSAISTRAASHLTNLAKQLKLEIEIETVEAPANTPGCNVSVIAQYERGMAAGSMMGTRGLRVETLAESAFEQVYAWMRTDSCLDPFLADQILMNCVFAEGPSAFSVSNITKRLTTSIWVIKQFMPLRVTVQGVEGGPGVISIQR